MLAYLYWNPSRVFFTLPVVEIPIYWYGLFFAVGFVAAYYIFIALLAREYKKGSSLFSREDIANLPLLHKKMSDYSLFERCDCKESSIIQSLNAAQHKGFSRKRLEEMLQPGLFNIREKAQKWTDRFSLWIVIATIVGARLGHLLFYEPPSFYLHNPLVILMTWQGGLASHGAVFAIFITVVLYAKKKHMDWLVLLDLLSIPAAIVAGMIRIGNFFNQEILGTPTHMPWGIVFGTPFDGSAPMVSHPVQLYESLFYLATGLFLTLFYERSFFKSSGKRFGLFITLIFSFRFFIEIFKKEQSHLYEGILSMGQLLSIPLIVIGILFLIRTKKESRRKSFSM